MINRHSDEALEPSRIEFEHLLVNVLKLTFAKLGHYKLHALNQAGFLVILRDPVADETHLEIEVGAFHPRKALRLQPAFGADFRPWHLRLYRFHKLSIPTYLLAKEPSGVRHIGEDPWHVA
ncbi:hypothetical protein D3C81_1968030 [compost metagenome]